MRKLGWLTDSDRDPSTERRYITPGTPAAKDHLGVPNEQLTLQKHKTFESKETYIQFDPLLIQVKKPVLVSREGEQHVQGHTDTGGEIKPRTRLNTAYAFPGTIGRTREVSKVPNVELKNSRRGVFF